MMDEKEAGNKADNMVETIGFNLTFANEFFSPLELYIQANRNDGVQKMLDGLQNSSGIDIQNGRSTIVEAKSEPNENDVRLYEKKVKELGNTVEFLQNLVDTDDINEEIKVKIQNTSNVLRNYKDTLALLVQDPNPTYRAIRAEAKRIDEKRVLENKTLSDKVISIFSKTEVDHTPVRSLALKGLKKYNFAMAHTFIQHLKDTGYEKVDGIIKTFHARELGYIQKEGKKGIESLANENYQGIVDSFMNLAHATKNGMSIMAKKIARDDIMFALFNKTAEGITENLKDNPDKSHAYFNALTAMNKVGYFDTSKITFSQIAADTVYAAAMEASSTNEVSSKELAHMSFFKALNQNCNLQSGISKGAQKVDAYIALKNFVILKDTKGVKEAYAKCKELRNTGIDFYQTSDIKAIRDSAYSAKTNGRARP